SPLPAPPATPVDPNAAQPAQPQPQPQPQAQGQTPAQTVPDFAAQLPNAIVQAQAQAQQSQVQGTVPSPLSATDPQTAANVPAPPEPVKAPPTGIPLSVLAGLTQIADPQNGQAPPAPATPDLPAAAPTPDPAATALPDPAAALQQQQAGANPQPQPPQPVETQTFKPAEPQAQAPVVTTTPIIAPPTAPPVAINTPTGIQRLVPMSRVPETTATMIHIAAERGVTHARLNLKPVELGGIEVRLRTTPQGIEAKLVADSPEAAKMLHTAADDLRRDLAARDVNLLSLDVSTQSDQQQDQPAQFGDEFGDSQSFGFAGGRRRNGSADDAGLTETPAAAETTLVLPNGVLVDVLA
ncbi:MAG: flagellar hook-length control protein FliK, partial [Catenulispora sp.]